MRVAYVQKNISDSKFNSAVIAKNYDFQKKLLQNSHIHKKIIFFQALLTFLNTASKLLLLSYEFLKYEYEKFQI